MAKPDIAHSSKAEKHGFPKQTRGMLAKLLALGTLRATMRRRFENRDPNEGKAMWSGEVQSFVTDKKTYVTLRPPVGSANSARKFRASGPSAPLPDLELHRIDNLDAWLADRRNKGFSFEEK